MAPRANWKGYLRIVELTCPVALYTAASTSDRIAFHTLNRATGNRVRRQFVDGETGKVVEKEEQVKGYEAAKDEYVVLEPAEIAAAIPESDKTLAVESFIPCDAIDTVYFDKPYYLRPADAAANEAYAVIREAMRKAQVAALAHTVLFRRMRTVLIRSYDCGLVATTLHFDYEVRAAADAFSAIPEIRIKGEMLDLARHIIKTKRGRFDPGKFEDRYEEAIADLVKAKLEGREIEARPRRQPEKVVSLMEALRQSAGAADGGKSSKDRSGRPTGGKGSRKTATKAAPRQNRQRKAG